jgi:hypothetical protein
LAAILFMIGYVLFGVAMIRTSTLPCWSGVLLRRYYSVLPVPAEQAILHGPIGKIEDVVAEYAAIGFGPAGADAPGPQLAVAGAASLSS